MCTFRVAFPRFYFSAQLYHACANSIAFMRLRVGGTTKKVPHKPDAFTTRTTQTAVFDDNIDDDDTENHIVFPRALFSRLFAGRVFGRSLLRVENHSLRCLERSLDRVQPECVVLVIIGF